MAASSTWNSQSVSNISLVSARCTGFAKVQGRNDYAFVIDLDWSDDRSMSIKRTYTEFQSFHGNLLKLFPELKQVDRSRLNLKTGIKENMTSIFAKDKRVLAESRECMLDCYLRNLLRQPERIRKSNLVLSFFESKESDPKPCKSNSPSEKSDSGIDLTSDRSDNVMKQDIGIQHEASEDIGVQCGDHEAYLNEHCNVGASCRQQYRDIDDDNANSSDDYDGDTSETETDDDTYDEDYFLDVGFGELMLQKPCEEDNIPLSPTNPESSMWCSNLDKFSNILKTSIGNLPSVDLSTRQYKQMNSLCSINASDEDDDIGDCGSASIDNGEHQENSETESQRTPDDRLSDGLESDDEFSCKPLSQNNMKHYCLSTADIFHAE